MANTVIPTMPTAPNRSMDSTTFTSTADTWVGALGPVTTAMNTLGTEIEADKDASATSAASATTQASNAAASAVNAAASGGATAWVNGGTYVLNAAAISQINFNVYRKKTASSVTTTDPANDSTNWISTVVPKAAYVARTSNTQLEAADSGKFFDITSGSFTQTVAAASTLGNEWHCFYRNSGTGAVVIDPNASETIGGASTLTTKNNSGSTYIVFCDGTNLKYIEILLSVGDHEVVVHTGNGNGSTNNCIRRFTTTMTSVGTAITYADSATLGGTFTINEAGLYSIFYEESSTQAVSTGITLNSSQLTTGITSVTVANRLIMFSLGAGAGLVSTSSRTVRLAAGDVIRAHNTSSAFLANSIDTTLLAIRKVGL